MSELARRGGSGETPSAAALALPMSLDAPALARLHVRQFAPHLTPASLDDALIVTSELVTNAVLHGEPDITLSVTLTPHLLAVRVGDGSSKLPPTNSGKPSPNTPGGRGLSIVNAIATDWGVIEYEAQAGKEVWFTLKLDD